MSLRNCIRLLLCNVAVVISLPAITIGFEDGVFGDPIANSYSPLGVTFSNAQYDDFPCQPLGSPGCTQFGDWSFAGISNLYNPTAADPIIATFTMSATFVSVYALNVGSEGARIDAYDSVTGGNLLGSDQAFGIDAGIENNVLLQISAPGIRRLSFYQPLSAGGEGVVFDLLTFTPVPEPATTMLIVAGLAGLGFLRGRRGTADR